MEPDAATYRLTRFGLHDREVLLETSDQAEILTAVQKLDAHTLVLDARHGNWAGKSWAFATLFYVWLTGIVTGGAVLALYLIYLKKWMF